MNRESEKDKDWGRPGCWGERETDQVQLLYFPHWCKKPSTLVTFCVFPRHIGRELVCGCSSWSDLWCCYGMLEFRRRLYPLHRKISLSFLCLSLFCFWNVSTYCHKCLSSYSCWYIWHILKSCVFIFTFQESFWCPCKFLQWSSDCSLVCCLIYMYSWVFWF